VGIIFIIKVSLIIPVLLRIKESSAAMDYVLATKMIIAIFITIKMAAPSLVQVESTLTFA
jgi:hypothetical protein